MSRQRQDHGSFRGQSGAGTTVDVVVLAENGEVIDLAKAGDTLEAMREYVAGIVWNVDGPAVIAILGSGTGALPAAVHARWPDAVLVIVEPSGSNAELTRSRLASIVTPGRVLAVATADSDSANDLWRAFDQPSNAVDVPRSVVHPVLARAMPNAMKATARVLGQAVAGARMNAHARATQAGPYLLNTLRNLRHIVRGPDITNLRERLRGAPAIVVGAGPSLDRQIGTLRKVASRAVVIATDTAWRPLADAGIDPHIVVALDPTADNGRHLREVPAAVAPWIVTEGSVDPPALAALAGRVAVFRVADHHPWPWLAAAGLERGRLRAWGSVLTSTLDLALFCGCTPIVLVGADLSFPGGQPYCRGTTHEDFWSDALGRGASLEEVWTQVLSARPRVDLPDLRGGTVSTSPHLVAFRDWIVTRAREVDLGRVVNASGQGILQGPGIVQSDLADMFRDRGEVASGTREILERWGRESCLDLDERLVQRLRDAAVAERSAWVAFVHPGTNPAALDSALDAGLDSVVAPEASAEVRTPVARRRWYAADRILAARALLRGEPQPVDGPAALSPDDATRATTDGIAIAEGLLRGVELIDPDAPPLAQAGAVPLSCRLPWRPEARLLVVELEEIALDLARSRTRAAGIERPGYWHRSVEACAPDRAASPSRFSLNAVARAAIEIERISLRTASPAAAVGPRDRRLIEAARRGVADVSMWRDASVGIQVSGTRIDVPVTPAVFATAVTGTLVRDEGDHSDPRYDFLREAVTTVEPIVVSGDGVTTGWTVGEADAEHAIFTPASATASLLVDSAGRLGPRRPGWPGPISGERPWGGRGGALAWNAADWSWFWRVEAGASPTHGRCPFRPLHLASLDDGDLVWGDHDGGLWRWAPGRTAVKVCQLPGAGIPRCADGRLVIGPVLRDSRGLVVRQRVDYEWVVDPRSGHWRVVAAGPAGQGAKGAVVGDCRAVSYPFGDAIGLHLGERRWWLACHAPSGLAWAGRSLCVTTGHGDLLLFAGLATALEQAGRGPQLAL